MGCFYIFGYGSLIFAPELADRVVDRVPARLVGHRRFFNKRSSSRFVEVGESYAAFEPPDPMFVRGSRYYSLVLGTEPEESDAMVGVALAYRNEDRAEVLALTDRREGYAVAGDPLQNGYQRRPVKLERLDNGASLSAETYLSNPDRRCPWRVPDHLTLNQRAQVLINATPKALSNPDITRDSRGLFYLEGVRRRLATIQIIDPNLEALAAAIDAHEGPWREELSEPAG